MANLPIGFAVGSSYGVGVYQSFPLIITPALPEAGIKWGIDFFAPSGEITGTVLQNGVYAFFDAKITEKNKGGVESFSFKLRRGSGIPFFFKMDCRVRFQGEYIFSGYLDFTPSDDTADVLEFIVRGYAQQLESQLVNITLTGTKTLTEVYTAMKTYINNTDIRVNDAKVILPNESVTGWEIKDKSLWWVFEQICSIANRNGDNYRFFVDENRVFNIRNTSTSVIDAFFEGYNFQSPEIKDKSDKLVNQIKFFRSSTGGGDPEEVAVYDDTESQGIYGVVSKKATFADYIDSSSISNIADSIFALYAYPIKEIQIDDVIRDERLEFGKYALNSRPRAYKRNVSECDSLTGWGQYLSGVSIALEDTIVISGRKAFKITTASGSGSYMEYELDTAFYFATQLMIWINQINLDTVIAIDLYDENNNIETHNIEYKWASVWTEFKFTVALQNVKKLRLRVVSNNANTIYIDRIDIIVNAWFQNVARLEKAVYEILKEKLLCNFTFGDQPDSIIDEIINDNQQNNIALQFIERS